jgi:hypothetical protein
MTVFGIVIYLNLNACVEKWETFKVRVNSGEIHLVILLKNDHHSRRAQLWLKQIKSN